MTDNGNATVAGGPRTLELAGRTVTIEPPSGRKASRAFALIRAIGREAPELITAWGEFETTYQAEHYVEIDRANAELRYGPEPLVREGELVVYPDGHAKAGEPIMLPGALESMTEEAWRAVDNKLRLPERPGLEAKLANIIRHDAIERAEENVYRLVALFAMPNADVKRYRQDGSFNERLEDLVNELLDDADLIDLLELAVVAGEVIDEQFRTKAEKLGGRMGNALRVLGLEPRTLAPQTAPEAPQTAPSAATPTPDSPATSTDTPSSSSSTSSGDGETASDGMPTPSSTPTGERSPALAGASTRSG
jgi:hypothetical protein